MLINKIIKMINFRVKM